MLDIIRAEWERDRGEVVGSILVALLGVLALVAWHVVGAAW